jgi:hypothetical protein
VSERASGRILQNSTHSMNYHFLPMQTAGQIELAAEV